MVMHLERSIVLRNRVLWLMPVGLFLLISMTCIQTQFDAQGIYVEELVITDSLDENGKPVDSLEVFHPDTNRIYCFTRVPALSNEKLHIQWYYEDDLIGTVENVVSNQGDVSWFLTQPTDQPIFPEGQYRAEIIYNDVQLRSISFRVEEAE